MTLIVLIVLAAIIAAPFIAEWRRKPMDGAARNDAPGQFVDLADGTTHIRTRGPEDGPFVVCVHGLTTPEYVWDDIAEALAAQGYRVISYDLYGRGYSDRPGNQQNEAFFLRQLEGVLSNVDVPQRFTLMGYSMGAGISVAYASRNPDRIEALVLIAPAGMSTITNRLEGFIRNTPVIGDWLVRVFGGMIRRQQDAREGKADPKLAAFNQRQLTESDYRGFLPAVLSSSRHMLKERQTAEHQKLAADQVPTLAIWGEADAVIPISAMGEMTQANRSAIHETVAGADHGVPYTHPGEVTHIIRDFLLRH